MNQNEATQAALDLASDATALSAGLLLLLWRQKLIPAGSESSFENLLRKMARDMERLGNDHAATELWTTANLLGKRPPTDRG